MRSEHEGKGYAEYFASRGFHCFVCEYRVDGTGRGLHSAPLEDALYSVLNVRNRAEELGFSPHSIGVVGSSAGGHLAAHVSTVSADWGKEFRPDWTILCYPVIALFGPAAHPGSRANLLGPRTDDLVAAKHSPHCLVDEKTPPCFLWHTMGDESVPLENSLLYVEALRKKDVPFELHISEKGHHGLGLGSDFDWAASAVRWLELRV